MAKLDYIKDFKTLYNPSVKEASMVETPDMNFLMIDGAGDPNTAVEFKEAVEALYGAAYTLKFSIKKAGGPEYSVAPLEGLWWMEDMNQFSMDNKDAWLWTVMIPQPDFVTRAQVDTAIADLKKKKNPPALPKLRFERFSEGKSAQIMHIGPFADEAPTILKLHEFIRANGCELTGKHHEIYLSDPRRCAPEKMKTVIRQPVRKV